MIHYHGLPITPATAAVAAVSGGHGFVSFRHPQQLTLAMEVCQSFAVDNGAFSAWSTGTPITEWGPFYAWVEDLHRCPSLDFACIPDVIDGDEAANDALVEQWPWVNSKPWLGAPVWHMHESLERLGRLAGRFPRVCLGSSAQFSKVGSQVWEERMIEAMEVLCDKDGLPACKLHGLRMLNPKVFTRFPFASTDSTNIARNVGIDSKWKGTYLPPTKESRARVMRERIESHQAPTFWERTRSANEKAAH